VARAHDEPIPLGDSLHAVVRGLRPETTSGTPAAPAAALGALFGRWEQAVGAAVAAHVQPIKLDGTTLVVMVDDPAWATQLKFLEGTLRERLLEVAGARIERLEVRVARPGR
jgi:predicted nucleic acid-binding Zn ribbon protein